ncbi:MAG TPA: hypothetical protein DHW42_03455 [Candidatus Marinimicrobia bacterium]|nr:hypothetical protein [Candidatus Neomarinimicrobiota bacterium]
MKYHNLMTERDTRPFYFTRYSMNMKINGFLKDLRIKEVRFSFSFRGFPPDRSGRCSGTDYISCRARTLQPVK